MIGRHRTWRLAAESKKVKAPNTGVKKEKNDTDGVDALLALAGAASTVVPPKEDVEAKNGSKRRKAVEAAGPAAAAKPATPTSTAAKKQRASKRQPDQSFAYAGGKAEGQEAGAQGVRACACVLRTCV